MRYQTRRSRRSPLARVLSTILFVAAIGFGGAAVYLWYTDDDNNGPNPPPPAESGNAELANVVSVLQEDEPGWDYGRMGVRSNQFVPPGQPLEFGEISLYVFIFAGDTPEEGVAAREQAADAADLGSMELTASNQVVNQGQTLHMAEASNVITILVGGDDALADQVQESLNTLP